MHPLGCFGSSLAFAPQTPVCQGCWVRTECEARVEGRRPLLLKLLSHYTDQKGEFMAVHWLKPDEKKKLKARRKTAALAEAERRTFGDPAEAFALKAKLDKRAHGLLDQMSLAGINPKRAPIECIGALSKPLRALVSLLLAERRFTMSEATALLASRFDYSARTAQREAYSLASVLTVCDRAHRVGPTLELK